MPPEIVSLELRKAAPRDLQRGRGGGHGTVGVHAGRGHGLGGPLGSVLGPFAAVERAVGAAAS